MKIRSAVLDDLEKIYNIETKCFPMQEAATKEQIKKRLQYFPEYFWVLEAPDGIIGFINGKECKGMHRIWNND